MGRPSKYNPALQKKFDDLVDSIGDIEIKDTGEKRKVQITRLIEEFFTYGYLRSLVVYLEIGSTTLYEWINPKEATYNSEIAKTFKRWDDKRRAILFKITPFIDKSLAIFFNKAINGFIEVQGVNLKTQGEVKSKVQIYLPDNKRDTKKDKKKDTKKVVNRIREIVKPKVN